MVPMLATTTPSVAAGEGDVAVVNHYYLARMINGNEADREAASKVRVIFPNQKNRGTHVNVSGAGVVKTAPNQENAVKFIEFLASNEAQQNFASGNQEYPVLLGIETTPTLKIKWHPSHIFYLEISFR